MKRNRHRSISLQPAYDDQTELLAFLQFIVRLRRSWELTAFAQRLAPVFPFISDVLEINGASAVYLAIAQLHDRPTSKTGRNSADRHNLTLRWAIDKFAPPVGTRQRTAIEKAYKTMAPTVDRLKREWRHRIGAHPDLRTLAGIAEHIAKGTPNPAPHFAVKDLFQTVTCIFRITELIAGNNWYEQRLEPEIETLAGILEREYRVKFPA